MIDAVQLNPYKMGKLIAVLENHPIGLGFANAAYYFPCSLGLRNAFFVFTFLESQKLKSV
jgi:hypothetical protein